MTPHLALTGGPGTGKTTLAAEFARRGFAAARESGRAVVRAHPVGCNARLRHPRGGGDPSADSAS